MQVITGVNICMLYFELALESHSLLDASHNDLFKEIFNLFWMVYLFFSTQVKIQPVAKYDWEHKYYYGRLIAVSNSFLAYAIRGESPETSKH